MDDSKILELYWSRDEQAIAETRASYGVPLLTLANRILSSREDSEETVSDTYLRAWQTIPPERPKDFLAFLRRICRNLAFARLDWNRAAKRNPKLIALTAELEQCIPDLRQGEISDRLSLKATLEAFLRQLPKESPYVQGLWSSVSEGDSVSILLWLEQSFSSEMPFETGVPYILHLTDLEASPFGEPVKRLQEGEWDFEVVFDHLSREQMELLTEPVTTVSQDYPGISLTLTSWKLRALGMDVEFEPGSQDYLLPGRRFCGSEGRHPGGSLSAVL